MKSFYIKIIQLCIIMTAVPLLCMSQSLISKHQCGTQPTKEQVQKLLKYKAICKSDAFIQKSGDTYFVPLKFHIIGTDDGVGYMSEETILEEVCLVNEQFEEVGLHFYVKDEFTYTDNTDVYNSEIFGVNGDVDIATALQLLPLALQIKDPNAINIYINNSLGGPGGVSIPNHPLFGEIDIIIMVKNAFGRSTLSHEIGHHLSLMHTFFGWENNVYDPTNPTPEYFLIDDDFVDLDTLFVEYVDRTKNCEFSGDFFCDTPPDYFWEGANSCDYQGPAVDPDGVQIDPDERNIMSYFPSHECEEEIFSGDQSAAMLASYFDRPELQGLDDPDVDPVVAATELLLPPQDMLIEDFEEIEISWTSVEHASHYLVQVSIFDAFDQGSIIDYSYTTNTNYTFTKAYKNSDFYWRVLAFNSANPCDEKTNSSTRVFSTGSGSTNVSEFESDKLDLLISPNPLDISKNNAIYVISNESLENLAFNLFDVSGQLVMSNKIDLNKGINEIEIMDFDRLNSGVYFLHFENAKNKYLEKLIVL